MSPYDYSSAACDSTQTNLTPKHQRGLRSRVRHRSQTPVAALYISLKRQKKFTKASMDLKTLSIMMYMVPCSELTKILTGGHLVGYLQYTITCCPVIVGLNGPNCVSHSSLGLSQHTRQMHLRCSPSPSCCTVCGHSTSGFTERDVRASGTHTVHVKQHIRKTAGGRM